MEALGTLTMLCQSASWFSICFSRGVHTQSENDYADCVELFLHNCLFQQPIMNDNITDDIKPVMEEEMHSFVLIIHVMPVSPESNVKTLLECRRLRVYRC